MSTELPQQLPVSTTTSEASSAPTASPSTSSISIDVPAADGKQKKKQQQAHKWPLLDDFWCIPDSFKKSKASEFCPCVRICVLLPLFVVFIVLALVVSGLYLDNMSNAYHVAECELREGARLDVKLMFRDSPTYDHRFPCVVRYPVQLLTTLRPDMKQRLQAYQVASKSSYIHSKELCSKGMMSPDESDEELDSSYFGNTQRCYFQTKYLEKLQWVMDVNASVALVAADVKASMGQIDETFKVLPNSDQLLLVNYGNMQQALSIPDAFATSVIVGTRVFDWLNITNPGALQLIPMVLSSIAIGGILLVTLIGFILYNADKYFDWQVQAKVEPKAPKLAKLLDLAFLGKMSFIGSASAGIVGIVTLAMIATKNQIEIRQVTFDTSGINKAIMFGFNIFTHYCISVMVLHLFYFLVNRNKRYYLLLASMLWIQAPVYVLNYFYVNGWKVAFAWDNLLKGFNISLFSSCVNLSVSTVHMAVICFGDFCISAISFKTTCKRVGAKAMGVGATVYSMVITIAVLIASYFLYPLFLRLTVTWQLLVPVFISAAIGAVFRLPLFMLTCCNVGKDKVIRDQRTAIKFVHETIKVFLLEFLSVHTYALGGSFAVLKILEELMEMYLDPSEEGIGFAMFRSISDLTSILICLLIGCSLDIAAALTMNIETVFHTLLLQLCIRIIIDVIIVLVAKAKHGHIKKIWDDFVKPHLELFYLVPLVIVVVLFNVLLESFLSPTTTYTVSSRTMVKG